MSMLFNAMNQTATTDNGCVANHSSLSRNLDFFYLGGASRGKDISVQFKLALAENEDLALRILMHLRDVREGVGERQLFRDLLVVALNEFKDTESQLKFVKVIEKIPELGRFDDLLFLLESNVSLVGKHHVLILFRHHLIKNNGLAFKWAPIKGDTAKVLRKAMGYKREVDWRKFIVAGRKTVEQQMCANEWEEIEYSKIPSVASARYQKAFGRHSPERYAEYLESLKKGETKINASAVYPHDIFKSCFNGNPEIAQEQWKALPNYMQESNERILPVIDVSDSMNCAVGGSNSLSCKAVAISLGWYIAERNVGIFQRKFITFAEEPMMLDVPNNLSLKNTFEYINRSNWGGSTDIEKTFRVVLESAVSNNVPQSEMPTQIIILSDMQFNKCQGYRGVQTSMFNSIKMLYTHHAYQMPKLVFWNLNAANTSVPVTKHDTGTALVSGFSPSIMKGILKGGMTPERVMLDTVMVDRYKI